MLCDCSAPVGQVWQGVPVTSGSSSSSSRRIGTTDSKTRAQLVDAAEELLLEEGYAAVTSRRVAAKAGLKPQLVHYYFRTMDDLFLEVYRRRADENLARFEKAVAEDGSLRALWRLNIDPAGAAFSIEFAALPHHRTAIRTAVARPAERFRNAQLGAVRRALATAGVDDKQMPPIAALLLMTGLGQMLGIEQSLGVTAGHRATRSFIEKAITLMESDS